MEVTGGYALWQWNRSNHSQLHKFLELKYGPRESGNTHLIWCQTPGFSHKQWIKSKEACRKNQLFEIHFCEKAIIAGNVLAGPVRRWSSEIQKRLTHRYSRFTRFAIGARSPVTWFHAEQFSQTLLFPMSRRVSVVSLPNASGTGPYNPTCVKFLLLCTHVTSFSRVHSSPWLCYSINMALMYVSFNTHVTTSQIIGGVSLFWASIWF